MITIAIDIRPIGKGRTGDETVFLELVRHLAQRGSDTQQYILLTDAQTAEEQARIAALCGIAQCENFRIEALRSGNKFLWNAVLVPHWLRRNKVHVYHTQYIVPLGVPRRTKIVTHIHDVSFLPYGALLKTTDRLFLRMLIPRALTKAAAVVAVSQFTKEEIMQYYDTPAEKITVVPNAVRTDFACKDAAAVRAQYDLPEQYIFSLGSNQPRKNIPMLITAFAAIMEECPDVTLVLAGAARHHFDTAITEAMKAVPDPTRIKWVGYIAHEDLPCVYKGAVCFAYPSLYEGYGLPPLEALAMGTNVLVSDIAPHREACGDAAHYIAPEDADAWAQALAAAVSQKAVQKPYTHPRYSWSKSAEILQELYGTLDKMS